jgi:uncharacterized membrane protein
VDVSERDDYLGTLGGRSSYAYALNSRGQISGTSDIAGNAAAHAVLWQVGREIDDETSGVAANLWRARPPL